MGAIYPGVPKREVEALQRVMKATTFIETGTYAGDTAHWASGIFSDVLTIEADQDLYRKAKERFHRQTQIKVVSGTSETILHELVPQFSGTLFFWLDAHWSGPGTFGVQGECPILRELAIINTLSTQTCVMIDDARLFLAPPPRPHSPEHWPDIASILDVLRENRDRQVYVWRDVIFGIPREYAPVFQELIRDIYEQK